MKQNFIKVLSALALSQIITISSFAQTTGVTAINLQLRGLFGNLILPPSPKLFLYDMSVKVADSVFYQSYCPDTGETDIWYRIYEEMYYSAYDTTLFENVEGVFGRANAFYGDTIPFGIMNYDFYKLKANALTTGIYFNYDTVNNVLTDKFPRPRFPYDDSSMFMAAPLVSESYYTNPTFRIDPSFFFYDSFNATRFGPEGILKIDFGDGNGFVQFNTATITHHTVNYSTDGVKYYTVILEDPVNNSVLCSSMSSLFVLSSSSSVPPDSSLNLPGLNIGIYSGCNPNPQSSKFVIYLAGFDIMDAVPSYARSVENIYTEMISNNSVVQLKNQGYSFIVVKFNNCRIDMRFNALYVVNLIEKLKCGIDMGQQFVIMGESMGGLIGRYVLTYMESSFYDIQSISPFFADASEPANTEYLSNHPGIFNLPSQWCITSKRHNTRLLITLDAPHQGAHIPISMQYVYGGILKLVADKLGINAKYFTNLHNQFLDAMSARQMLLYHVNSQSGGSFGPDPAKTRFFNQLDQLGDYPKYCKVTALSNGSLSGELQTNYYTHQPRTPGDRLIDMDFELFGRFLGFKIPLAKATVDARTNPNGYGQVFQGQFALGTIQLKLYWFGIKVWWGYANIINDQYSVSSEPYCTAPGGFVGDPTLISSTPSISPPYTKHQWLRYFFDYNSIVNGNGCKYNGGHFGFKGIAALNLNLDFCSDGFHFTLVPVQSALDYGSPGQFPLNHDIEGENIHTKLSRVKPSVIIGYPDKGIFINRFHTGNSIESFRNSDIFNLTKVPGPVNPYTYYSCINYNDDVQRGLINLEIGDEELYLENTKLGWAAVYQTEYDIHVNERNPYYEYALSPNFAIIPGYYSKQEDYVIEPGGMAIFITDQPNSPTGIGLNYRHPMTGPFNQLEEPLQVCCINFIGARVKQFVKAEAMAETESFINIYPNPLTGNDLVLNFKFKQKGSVQMQLFTSLGQILTERTLQSQNASLESTEVLSLNNDLKNGLYFVRLSCGEESITSRLIVTNR